MIWNLVTFNCFAIHLHHTAFQYLIPLLRLTVHFYQGTLIFLFSYGTHLNSQQLEAINILTQDLV